MRLPLIRRRCQRAAERCSQLTSGRITGRQADSSIHAHDIGAGIDGAKAAAMRRWPRHPAAVLAALTVVAAGPALAGCATDPGPLTRLPSPAHAAWVSSAPFGAWSNSGFIVYNNEWNTSQAGPQRIWADSFHSWGVASRQAGTGSVKTYPSVQRNFRNVPLSSFRRLSSTFAESMPGVHAFGAEAAYDLWLDNYKIEVMIWVDNHWRVPAGSQIAQISLGQQEFAVYQDGDAMFSFMLTGKQETAGKVDILAFFGWLVRHHYLRASAALAQVDFGWEIASTEGVPLVFRMRQYTLAAAFSRG
jgi:hypothetical protein